MAESNDGISVDYSVKEFSLETTIVNEDKTKKEEEKDFTPSSMTGTVYNLICMIAGSGLLTLPWSFANSGLFPGIILCTLSCIIASFSFILVGITAEHTQQYSWRGIWKNTVGHKTAALPIFTCWLNIFVLNFIYLILTGNFLEGAFEDILSNSGITCSYLRPLILVGAAIFFVLPLSLLKDFTYLQYSSLVANLGLLYVMFILIFKSTGIDENKIVIDYWKLDWGGLLSCISIQMTSFGAHALAPQVYEEMRDRSPKNFAIVVIIAFSICWIITMTFGIAGYLAFGNIVEGDVMKTYRNVSGGIDWVIVMAKFILAANMIATQAIFYSALARETICLVAELNAQFKKNWMQKIQDFITKHKRFVFVPCSLAIILGLSLRFKDVEVLGSFVGSTAGAWTIVIFPAIVYIYSEESKFAKFSKFLFIFGILISLLCLVQFILRQANVKL